MEKITKKEFYNLHKNNKLKLVYSFSNKNKKEALQLVYDVITKKGYDIFKKYLKNVTSVNVESQGKHIDVKVFQSGEFFLIEYIIDNSKINTVSWDNVQINTIVYYKIP